jgi:hypothetical protein
MDSGMFCNLNDVDRRRGGRYSSARGAGSMRGSTRTLFSTLPWPNSLLNTGLLSVQMLAGHLSIAAVLRMVRTVTPATDRRRWSGEWREGGRR